jgi:uncharacterized protein (TIGR02271 family)
LAGKAVAEHVNPTAEDAYWREHYTNEPYYDRTYTYDDYQGAYRTGYEGYSRLGSSGKTYNEIESELRKDYERNYRASKLSWDKARPAVRAAWDRFNRNLERYIGYDVVDRNGNPIGTLECLWTDHTGEPAFVGVRTGWLFGKTHVVPADSVEVSKHGGRIRLPYTEEKVKEAPAYETDAEMTLEKEQEVYRYYGISSRMGRTGTTGATGVTGATSGATTGRAIERERTAGTGAAAHTHAREEASIPLAEERLRVEKREVEAGGVRLRKIVRTVTTNTPVELRREEVIVERVPAGQAGRTTGAPTGAFQEQEIYIPLRREEAVVQKETRLREEVHVRKESRTDREQVSDQVRREDVEVQRTGEAVEDRPRTQRPGNK